MDPLHSLVGSPLGFQWAPLCFLLGSPSLRSGSPSFFYRGSPLVSNGHPFILLWVPPAFLMAPLIRPSVSPLVSPSLSIGVLFVSDGNLPIRNQMGITWKAQENPIEE